MSTIYRRASPTIDATRLVLGLVLVALGLLFLGDQAGLLSAGAVIRSGWPVILIVYGVAHYLTSRWLTGPLVVITIGLVLLLFTLDILPGPAGAVIWPLLLIALGIWIMLGRNRGPGGADDDSVVSYSIFGDTRIRRQSRGFAGGTIVEVFGDTTVDLRSATLAPDGASIDVVTVFSDVEILVPRGWCIALGGIPLLGDCDDTTEYDGPLPDDAPLLTVNVFALFGDLKIRN
jgi:predicted membrane protein